MISAILVSLWIALIPQSDMKTLDNAIGLYDHGKFLQAKEVFASLLLRTPKDATLHLWLGKNFLKLRRGDDAVREFESAVQIAPKDGIHHLWLARAYGNKAEHASIFSAFSLARKARNSFETAVKLSPDSLDARFDLLEYYAQAPGIVGGGREKAEAEAREISRISPRAGFTARAAIHVNNEEWEQARGELTQATQKFPDDPESWIDLAEFLLQRRDYEGAEAGARKALDLDGANRRARYCLAAARVELRRDLTGTIQVLQELTAGPLKDQDPAFEDVYYVLSRAWLAQGKTGEARRALEESLRFDPESRRIKEALAKIRTSDES